jgi:hypothetical protein
MRNISLPVVCTSHDPEIWHNDATEQLAVRLCTTGGPGGGPCPGLAACLDMSTDPHNHTFTKDGVWGGVNSHKRDRIRAGRARTGDGRYQTVTFTTTNRQTHVPESSL